MLINLNLGVLSKEFGLLVTLAGILVARTCLDIWFTAFNGVVVRSIVSKDWNLFVKNAIVLFGFMMWPMVSNALRYMLIYGCSHSPIIR